MMQDDAIVIVGIGAQTSLGRDVVSSVGAIRAGLCALAEHPFMIDRYGEPMVVARAEWLDASMPVVERVAAMTADAVAEAIAPLQATPSSSRGSIVLQLASSAEHLPSEGHRSKIAGVCIEHLRSVGAVSGAHWSFDGHAAGLFALEQAIAKLRGGEATLAVVVGADSWLDPQRLESIDYSDRLHSCNRSWGFSPGEGACCCVVARARIARELGLEPLAQIFAVASASESNLMGTQTICVGEGLTKAFRGVLSSTRKVNQSYCDFNGETYRADEFGFTACRTGEGFHDAGTFTAAAQGWGDVGAASGLLGIMLAVADWRDGAANGPVSLAWSSSATSPLRVAALLGEVGQTSGDVR